MRLMVDEARVPHAILFTENSGNGAIDIALDFVKYLFCTDKKVVSRAVNATTAAW